MLNLRQTQLATGALLLAAAPIFAHHAFSTEYDQSKPLTLKGEIEKAEWNEPHGYIYLRTKSPTGKEEHWKLETASPNALKNKGLKLKELDKGEDVTVNAYAATNVPNFGSARSIVMKSGQNSQVCDPTEDGGPAK